MTARSKTIVTRLIFFVIIIIAGIVAWSVWRGKGSDSSTERTSAETTVDSYENQVPSTVESRLLVVGDTFWGRHIELLSEQSSLGYAFPFQKLGTLNRKQYDAWVANVECPITTGSISYQAQIDTLQFNCRPEFLKEFAKWFDIVDLANNHSDNMNGEAGLLESRNHLEKAGLQHFGHFDPSVTDDICEVVSLPVRIINENGNKKGHLPVAFCGLHGVYQVPTSAQVDQIKPFAELMPTIVMPHMGAEYQPESDELREKLYRGMIERGADMVIGNQPHWVQNTESYQGKLIVYSVGNFIFDQAFEPDVSRGIGVDITVNTEIDDNLQAWLDLGTACQKFKDSCLERAQDQQLTKPDVAYDFKLVGIEATDYVTHKADAQTYRELLSRTRWNHTIKQLAR